MATALTAFERGASPVVVLAGNCALLRCSSSFACSFAKSRPNSATAEFSFWRTGVVPVRVRDVREPLSLKFRLRPNGPDSSGCRGFLEEL